MKIHPGTNKIDGFTLTGLLILLLATTTLLFIARVVDIVGHDGWMPVALVTLSAAGLIYIMYYLGQLFPGQSLIEYLPLLLGKAAGKLVGLGYVLFLVYLTASVISESIALFLGTGIFTFTPIIVIILLLVMASSYGVASGIVVIGRTLNIYWLGIMAVLIIYFILAISAMELEALLPVGEAGFKTILKGSMISHSYRGELFLLAMLLPYCRSYREGFIAANIANIIVGLLVIGTVVISVTILGVETSSRTLYTPFFLADFIKPVGIKIALTAIWIIAFWAKISLLQFCLTAGTSQLLELKQSEVIIVPIAIILVVFSLSFYDNATDLFQSIAQTFPGTALVFEWLIPGLLFVIAIIKYKLMGQDQSHGELDEDNYRG
jgi:spore germination protein KB